MKRLDDLLSDCKGFDVAVIKIDVEGYEKEVIKGGRIFLGKFEEVWLMVEDFVEPAIKEYLLNGGWEFAGKFTPYNSWWRIKNKKQKVPS